jgi:hypothetical protein
MAAIGNFEAIISNRVSQISIKFRFFHFASAMANFVDFTPLRNLFRERRSTEVRTPHPARTHAAGAAHRGTRLSAAHTITMSLFYQTISLLCEGGILKALVTLLLSSPAGLN